MNKPRTTIGWAIREAPREGELQQNQGDAISSQTSGLTKFLRRLFG